MLVSVRKANEDDVHKVHVLLNDLTTRETPWSSLESRRRMFRPIWSGSEGYYGYILETGDEVVGFLGTLFTEREIHGKKRKFCEIHNWYVKDKYRNESMRLFLPALSLRNAILLNYTPNKDVYKLCKKFGWEDLETKLLLFLPVPRIKSLGRNIEVETRKDEIIKHLDEANRQIYVDHENIECHHYLIREKNTDEYVYIIIKKLRLGRLRPFGRIMYVSNKEMFLKYIDYLKMHWCRKLGLLFVVMGRHEIETNKKLPYTMEVTRKIPSLYKSKDLKPQDIRPALYSVPLLISYRLH